MKKFLFKSAFFLLLVLSVIGGACLTEMVAEVRAYRRDLVAPTGASILLCGDSQMANDVDPAQSSSFFNFCAHGRTLDQTYLTMMDVLDTPENRGRVRQVVFDVSPASLKWVSGHAVSDLDFAGRYYLLYLLHWREARSLRSMDGLLGVARDNLVGRRLRHFWRSLRGKTEFRSSLSGGHTPSDKAYLVDKPETFAETVKYKATQAAGFERVGFGDFPFGVLDRVVAAGRSRGVEVVFVTTPWSTALVNACGQESICAFERRMTEFAATRHCRHISFLRMEFPPEAWMDANHLNSTGAAIFTHRLFKAVAEEGRVSDE